jgi:hypothetical protein
MLRSTRFGLVALAALLFAGGAYTAYWFLVARRIETGILDWAQSQRADKIDASWQKRVSGYPVTFRVDLGSAVLRRRRREASSGCRCRRAVKAAT